MRLMRNGIGVSTDEMAYDLKKKYQFNTSNRIASLQSSADDSIWAGDSRTIGRSTISESPFY